MASKLFISAKEVARELEVSDSFAYRLVRKLNDELEKQGFVVVKGKISSKYFEERVYGMSEKNMDKKNVWRNVTIAFRMSPEENEELDKRVKLCGYQTRQEYIIESVLYQKITAVGNPLMLVQFRKQLRDIETELKRLTY